MIFFILFLLRAPLFRLIFKYQETETIEIIPVNEKALIDLLENEFDSKEPDKDDILKFTLKLTKRRLKFTRSASANPNITFKQFYEKYNIDLNIFATSLTSRSNICFNKDNYPDVEILTVVQASSSIPLIFPPVIINDEYFIDGCMKCIDGVCNKIIEDNSDDINIIIKGDYTQKKLIHLLIIFYLY